MESSKFAVKFFATPQSRIEVKDFIGVFHGWIQNRALADHLLIDVATYDHVAEGPGVVLVSHQANISTDLEGGLGLLYVRKTPLEGDLAARFKAVLRYALQACRTLEQTSSLRFRTDNPVLRIADRLHAPNTPATAHAVLPTMQNVLTQIYGKEVQLQPNSDPENLFGLQAAAPAGMSVESLLARLKD